MMNPNENTKTGPPKSGGASTPLGRQGFGVIKDVLVEEMVKENRDLGLQNDELKSVRETLKVRVVYLGDEITVDLGDGKQTNDGYVIPIMGVKHIPLLDLAQNSLHSIAFSENSDKEWKLNVKLGNVAIGNPPMSILSIGSAWARSTASGRSVLTIALSPRVSISGQLSNVSSDDIADDFQDFNKKATQRLMIGVPAGPIRNERAIHFTLNSVTLYKMANLVEIASSNFDETVDKMPETIFRRQVVGTFDNDEMFRELLDKNVALKSANKTLVSTRKWLSNIDFQYHGGSLKLSIEDGLLVTRSRDGEKSVMIKLYNSDDGIEDYKSCPFNTLNKVRVNLCGIGISDHHSGPPGIDIEYNFGRIYIIYGPVLLVGRLDFRGIDPETFQWPGNNMARALAWSLSEELILPDEIHFGIAGLILRCANRHIAQVVEVLGMSDNDGAREDPTQPTDDMADEKSE